MNQLVFDTILNERLDKIKNTLISKGTEYASNADRLHNFKRAARFMGKTPEAACWGFAMKHLTSIADMIDQIDAGTCPSQAVVDEKLGDAINYIILLETIVKERIGFIEVKGVPVNA